MPTKTEKKPSARSTSAPFVYAFGQKPDALLAVKVSSDHRISIVAYGRPQNDPQGKMVPLFSSSSLKLAPNEIVPFTFELARKNGDNPPTDKVGIFTVEPAGWPQGYEMRIVHLLGYSEPFGTDEIDYNNSNRRADKPANRKFNCVLQPGGILKVVDGVSMCEETLNFGALDDVAHDLGIVRPNGYGTLFVAVRVGGINYEDNCVTLDFPRGPGFEITSADGTKYQELTKIVLNKSKPQSPE
jgi:hypothetical protein